ncbi:MAG: excinuclease ABC subunit UvrC, partial [Leptospiraceae bacterium]|nr:excinuclease ABC subunit UvrC [Leptospiraceae bacterium]
YPYICVSMSEPFPRIYLTRTVREDGNRYYGPYTDVRAARNVIALLHKIFPVRKVKQNLPLKKPRKPCMNFHIKRCLGPCQGNVPESDYRELIEQVNLFLEGRREILESVVTERMQKYSDGLEFEKAALYRDMLLQIRSATQQQSVVRTGSVADEDAIALARRDDHGQIVLLEIRDGRLLDRKSFPLVGLENAEESEVLESFIRDYYLESGAIPGRILMPARIPAGRRKVLTTALTERAGHTVILTHARVADELQSLVRLAARNAELLLSERLLATRLRDREAALKELESMLKLEELPGVIECYDISHTQGSETVASGVMFVDGAPHTAGYRRYRIRGVDGIDDPASMREVIGRRIQRLLNEDRALPDLILIDGGPTQLTAACEAAAALGAGDLPLVSLAKQREELYFPGESTPRSFDPNSPAMRMLRHLRDEAHRFAITHHRNRRNRATMRHVLDAVPDIGPARKQNLLKHFHGIKIESATLEQLQEVEGIGAGLARRIYDSLHAAAESQVAAES